MKYIAPTWPAPKNIHAYTTTRHGWDISAKDEQLINLFNLPSSPLWLDQEHTAIALDATQKVQGQIADASFTQSPNRVCIVQTADCLPVLLCHENGTSVAAIHAGWRGLAAGVIENTLDQLPEPEKMLAWLGPAIGPRKFEVGKDVYEAFTHENIDSAIAFTPISNEKWLADLYRLATLRLKSRGVQRIFGGEYCTFTQEDLFFSYRREGKNTGRIASLIWIST